MIDPIEIQPIRYLVTLHSKPLGMCIRSGDKWVFYCSLDGSITSGSTPQEATQNNAAVRERCQKEIHQDYHRLLDPIP